MFARAERFELPSTVLETAILPLNYARRILDPKRNAKLVRIGLRNKCDPENYSGSHFDLYLSQ